MDFGVPVGHWVKIKESEKRDKFLDLAREQKKKKSYGTWGWLIRIAISALGMVPNGFEKGLEESEIREKIETFKTTALLRRARKLRRVLVILGDLQSLRP